MATCTLVVVAFLWYAQFFLHFPAFLAPFLGLSIGLAAGRLAGAVQTGDIEAPASQRSPGSWAQWAVVGLAAWLSRDPGRAAGPVGPQRDAPGHPAPRSAPCSASCLPARVSSATRRPSSSPRTGSTPARRAARRWSTRSARITRWATAGTAASGAARYAAVARHLAERVPARPVRVAVAAVQQRSGSPGRPPSGRTSTATSGGYSWTVQAMPCTPGLHPRGGPGVMPDGQCGRIACDLALAHTMHRALREPVAAAGYSWWEKRSSCQGSAELW